MNKVLFKLLHPNAQSPKRAKENSAGFDMYAPERVEIHPGCSYWVKSGVSMAIPYGYVGLIHPRSGLAYKHSLTTLGGVIDADYRGEVLIGLHNLGKDLIEIKAGDRVCQMLVHAYMGDSETVEVLPEDTDRGVAGIGSTGT